MEQQQKAQQGGILESLDKGEVRVCPICEEVVVVIPSLGMCGACIKDLASQGSICKLGTLDKDNCEVRECTCGYH